MTGHGTTQVDQYLQQLPQGITSYPDCWATAVLFNRIVADHPHVLARCAHPALAAPGAPARDDRSWIPLTVQVSCVLALIDLHHGSVPRAQQQLRAYGADILSTPAYKLLFFVLSPAFIVMGVSNRYSRDFRGVRAASHEMTRTSGKMTLSFPPRLYSAAYVHAYNGLFEAALHCSGGKEVKSAVETVADTSATSLFTWS